MNWDFLLFGKILAHYIAFIKFLIIGFSIQEEYFFQGIQKGKIKERVISNWVLSIIEHYGHFKWILYFSSEFSTKIDKKSFILQYFKTVPKSMLNFICIKFKHSLHYTINQEVFEGGNFKNIFFNALNFITLTTW